MFTFELSPRLEKKTRKLATKDVVLATIFYKKVAEITSRDVHTVMGYKNLHSPMHAYKRVHLTDNYILLFTVDVTKKHIVFVDVLHWDHAYLN